MIFASDAGIIYLNVIVSVELSSGWLPRHLWRHKKCKNFSENWHNNVFINSKAS